MAVPPENRTVTYLVCRLRGSADEHRGLDAASVMTLLESALAPMRDAIAAHRGRCFTATAANWPRPGTPLETIRSMRCMPARRRLA